MALYTRTRRGCVCVCCACVRIARVRPSDCPLNAPHPLVVYTEVPREPSSTWEATENGRRFVCVRFVCAWFRFWEGVLRLWCVRVCVCVEGNTETLELVGATEGEVCLRVCIRCSSPCSSPDMWRQSRRVVTLLRSYFFFFLPRF